MLIRRPRRVSNWETFELLCYRELISHIKHISWPLILWNSTLCHHGYLQFNRVRLLKLTPVELNPCTHPVGAGSCSCFHCQFQFQPLPILRTVVLTYSCYRVLMSLVVSSISRSTVHCNSTTFWPRKSLPDTKLHEMLAITTDIWSCSHEPPSHHRREFSPNCTLRSLTWQQ